MAQRPGTSRSIARKVGGNRPRVVIVGAGFGGVATARALAELPVDVTLDGRVAELDPLSREGRTIQRHFFSGAAEAELDKQGRIMIPAPLLRYAGLDRDVVVAGVHDHLEIWDRETWRRELNEVEGSAEHVAERLAAKRD